MIKAWALAVGALTLSHCLALPVFAAKPSTAVDLRQAESLVREGRAVVESIVFKSP